MKFDLILVNIVYRAHNGLISSMPQLGLLSISTYATLNGIKSTVIHTDSPLAELKTIMTTSSAALIGFYCNSDNITNVLKTARLLKEVIANNREIKIVLGGPLADALCNDLMNEPAIDFVCRGDGEVFIVELIRALENKDSDFALIGGLSYKIDGIANHVAKRDIVKDLDTYPIPDRDACKQTDKSEKVALITSRGCGFKCAFCFESSQRTIRYHSVTRVINEIKMLLDKYDAQYITFSDDALTTNLTRLEEICKAIIANFQPFEQLIWYCEGRVDSLSKRPDLVNLMRRAGMARIQIGSESGCQKIIDSYGKNITIEQIKSAVKLLHIAGVQSIYTNFILGGPFESNEAFQKTVELMRCLFELAPGRFECSCNFLSPYPGTDIFTRPEHFELILTDTDFFTDSSGNYVCTLSKEFTKQILLERRRIFEAEQNFQMRKIAPNVPMALIREHLINSLRGLKTQWAGFFLTDEIFANWLNFIKTKKYQHELTNIAVLDVQKIVPCRTVGLTKINNGVLRWEIMAQEIFFSDDELLLLELFSGKLNFEEIFDIVYKGFCKKGAAPEALFTDIVNYAKQLSETSLVVFKTMRAL